MDRGFIWLNRRDHHNGAQVELKVGILLACYQLFLGYCHTIGEKWGVLFDTWVLSAYQMLFGGLLLLLGSALLEQPFLL